MVIFGVRLIVSTFSVAIIHCGINLTKQVVDQGWVVLRQKKHREIKRETSKC